MLLGRDRLHVFFFYLNMPSISMNRYHGLFFFHKHLRLGVKAQLPITVL